jgi:hypothetical protein
MGKKGGLLLALVLLGTGALRVMAPGGALPADASENAPKSSVEKQERGQGERSQANLNPSLGPFAVNLSDTIEAFFGVDRDAPLSAEQTPSPEITTAQRELIAHWNVPVCRRGAVRFLIALAPDPVHTELNLAFDRGVEIVQQAAQEEGYDFDRATMPWDSATHPENSDFQKREAEEAEKTARESLPGLMLFRPALELGAQSAKGPLFVFVVGETPTAGIHKKQFANALQIMCEIRGGCPDRSGPAPKLRTASGANATKTATTAANVNEPPCSINAPTPAETPLLILGPASSGSLYSLAKALKLNSKLIGDRRTFVFSGTARGTSQGCWFQSQQESDLKNVRYVPFQEGEDRVIRKFLDFTVSIGYEPQDTAILSEDETSYGYTDPPDQPDTPRTPPKKDPRCELGYGEYELKPRTTLLKLQFPRGISHFRAAYQKYVGVTVPPQDKSGGRAVLPLDLQATGSEDDTVASYAKVQFPLSQEAVMLGLVARLHDKHPKFILLRASDAVDQLFLTRYLRQNYPEARVVVTAPDLLYAREDDGLLHGVLGISAYSLVPQGNRYLCHPEGVDLRRSRSQRAFPGSSDQGAYNAMVSLLSIGKVPSGGNKLFAIPPAPDLKDLPPASYSGYGSFQDWGYTGSDDASSNGCVLAPDLWISVLARDGYWMAASIARDESSSLHAVDEKAHGLHSGSGSTTPKAWVFAFASVAFLLFLHSYLVWRGSIFSGSEIKARFGSIENPDPDHDLVHVSTRSTPTDEDVRRRESRKTESRDCKTRRARLLSWGTASLASILLLLIAVRYTAISRNECVSWTLLLTAFPLGFTGFVARHLRLRCGESGMAIRLIVGISIFALSILIPGIGPRSWMSSATAYRSMHLLSGVSPLLPILLLVGAFYCLAWYELQAVAVTDGRRPRLPRRDDLPPDYYRVSEEDQEELRNVATSLSLRRRVFLPIFFFLVPFVLLTIDFRNPHPVQTIEGHHYDWVYFYSLLLWLVLFLGCLSRLICIWNECRRFLAGLDNLPLRDAFRNLQDFSWNLIWAPSGSAIRDSFKYVMRELQSLRRLQTAIANDLGPSSSSTSEKPPATPSDSSSKKPDEQTIEVIDLKEVQKQIDLTFEIQEQAVGEYAGAVDFQRRTAGPRRTAKSADTPVSRNAPESRDTSESTDPLESPMSTALLMDSFGELQQQIAKTAGTVLKNLLGPTWRRVILPVASTLPEDWKKKPEDKTPMELVAEEFVSMVYANFLTSVLLRIRTLVLEAIGIFLFLLFSISSYPFEPNPDMFTLAVFLIVILGVVVAYVYSQMHRDPALSRLTSTAEGQVGFEFWVQLLSAGAIPVLSLLAVQFPSISRVLSNWLGPALQAIK